MPTLTIDPVTRIEGHARITVQLDEQGEVQDARFHVTQVRGFEKLCEGRPFTEMPALMARICGICPTSHLLASSKACDEIMAVRIPETAEKLRRIMNLAQIIQSHALSFFYLSSPDFLLGMDADPAERNIMGVVRKYPAMARDGIKLRQFGQRVLETLGGKRIHPGWIVPGGVSHPLEAAQRDQILAEIPEAIRITRATLHWFKSQIENFRAEVRSFANFPSLFLAMANDENQLAAYSGWLRFMDANLNIVADHITGARLPELHRRILQRRFLPQVHLLQAARIECGNVSRGTAGTAQHVPVGGHHAGRRGAGGVPRTGAPLGAQLLLLPLCPADRNPVLAGAHGDLAARSGDSGQERARPCRRPTTSRASAFWKRRGAR